MLVNFRFIFNLVLSVRLRGYSKCFSSASDITNELGPSNCTNPSTNKKESPVISKASFKK